MSGETPVTTRRRFSVVAAPGAVVGMKRLLSAASHLLVALLASSIVALCVSLAIQRRDAEEQSDRAAALARQRPVAPAKEVVAPPSSPEPPTTVAAETQGPLTVEAPPPPLPAPAVEPPAIVAVQPPAAPPADSPPSEIAAASLSAAPPAPKIGPMPALQNSPVATTSATPVVPGPARKRLVLQAPRAEPKLPPAQDDGIRPPEPLEEPEQPVEAEAVPADSDIARRAEKEAAEMASVEANSASSRPTQPTSPWSELRRGMSQEAVLALLGAPHWKRHLVTTEWWLYKENTLYGTGLVAFSFEEGLISWKAP
jgi:hypothetical protein